MDFSQCRASVGPQRRASVLSSKEYKYFTVEISKNKNAQIIGFWSHNIPKLQSYVLKFWQRITFLGLIYQPFQLKIHQKKNLSTKTCLKTSKKTSKKLWKSPENNFFFSKIVKNDPSKTQNWAKFWTQISLFGVIYQPLELKIHPNLGFLWPKNNA